MEHQLAIQFDVDDSRIDTVATAVENWLRGEGLQGECVDDASDEYDLIAIVDIGEQPAGPLRNRIESFLSALGGIEYHNVIAIGKAAPAPLGPRSRPSLLAERAQL